jgi:hypothetical protein
MLALPVQNKHLGAVGGEVPVDPERIPGERSGAVSKAHVDLQEMLALCVEEERPDVAWMKLAVVMSLYDSLSLHLSTYQRIFQLALTWH